MTQNEGWIKLNRNLFNVGNDAVFSKKDPLLNIQLYLLYIILAQQATWNDYKDLKRGQIKTKTSTLQKTIFPNLSVERVKKLIAHLIEKGYVKKIIIDKDDAGEYVLEICQYEQFSGENHENKRPPTGHLPATSCCDNLSDSLDKKGAISTYRPPTGHLPDRSACSYYIEERNKEEKEDINTFSEDVSRPRADDDEIIKVEPEKKAKKTPKPKAEGKSVRLINAYRESFQARYGNEPLINAKVRGQACSLVDRVGIDNCEAFIAFYLTHNNPRYIANAHTLGLALIDAEKLYTEFQLGDYITRDYVDSFQKKTSKFRI
jgi:hypothetical protein